MTPASNERNHLIAALPDGERARIEQLLEEIPLGFREDIYQTCQPSDYVWFPYRGVVSLVTEFERGLAVEVATIGPEGMIGIQHMLGTDQIAHRAFVQVAGHGARMTAEDFQVAIAENPRFEAILRRYVLALFNQVAQAAACNRAHSVEERMARWLLMTQDRIDASEFPLTQEFLAQMLGVRRPTVSVAAGMLSKAGLIHYVRGWITILDRPGLEATSCECYRVITEEFTRLVGAP